MARSKEFKVGQRIAVGDHKATVRYVGPVEGQTGSWVGLEWDDASRGKHDGIVAGKRYFQCQYSEGAASFVRRERLADSAETGCALVEAVRSHYCSSAAADLAREAGSGRQHAAVELVGLQQVEARQSQLDRLTKVTIQDAHVSSLGADGDAAAAVPSVSDLDLAGNLLSDWGVVPALAGGQLPALRILNLSDNRFAEGWRQRFSAPGLRVLVLNQTHVSWQQAVWLGGCLPSLEQLHLCHNGMHSLALDDTTTSSSSSADGAGLLPQRQWQQVAEAFPRLQLLDLDENLLSSWEEVERLAPLPALRTLQLNGNRLAQVRYPAAAVRQQQEEDGCTPSPSYPSGQAGQQQQQEEEAFPSVVAAPPFAALRCMLLGSNALNSWDDIVQLDRFPALEDIRVSGNPLLAERDIVGARLDVVARCGRLTTLNGAAVHRMERRDAELWYLRNIAGELEGGGGSEEQDEVARAGVEARHPRLSTLLSKYNIQRAALRPADTSAAHAGSRPLASSMASLTLRAGERSMTKRVPTTVTVAKLKVLAAKLLKLGDSGGSGSASSSVASMRVMLRLVGREGSDEDVTQEDGKDLALLGVVGEAEVLFVPDSGQEQ